MQGDLEGGRTHAPRAARMARALKVDISSNKSNLVDYLGIFTPLNSYQLLVCYEGMKFLD